MCSRPLRDDDTPNVVTHAATTAACVSDGAVALRVHRDLGGWSLPPGVHPVDTGFLDARLLVADRQEDAVELLGPTRRGRRWRARAGDGHGVDQSTIDWARPSRLPGSSDGARAGSE